MKLTAATLAVMALTVVLVSVALADGPPPPVAVPGATVEDEPSYDPASESTYLYYDDDKGHERIRQEPGEHWQWRAVCKKPAAALDALAGALTAKGAAVLGRSARRALFELPEEHGSLLVFATPDGDGLALEAVRLLRLATDGELTLRFPDEASNRRYVLYEHDGTAFRTLELTFEGESAEVQAAASWQDGALRRQVDVSTHRYAYHGARQEVLSLPQLAGTYRLHVTCQDTEEPRTVKLRMLRDAPLVPVPAGETLGGLLVEGAAWGAAKVVPEYDLRVEHPQYTDLSRLGDRTPDGQSLFWLPPGEWCVEVEPSIPMATAVRSHMVPVHPGRMTHLRLPGSLAGAFAPPSAGRLEILDGRGTATAATVDVAVVDAAAAELAPTPATTKVFEAGEPARVRAVERLAVPMDVVVLLDSSGSMKGSMKAAIDAVKRFVGLVPADARVRVVDFDTAPVDLPSATRTALLTALDGVVARGATCLFDSLIKGLDMPGSSPRPALVVFTDGVDANWNDTAPGSVATKQQVLDRAAAARIPVFTVGFGEKPDRDTLERVATLGGGAYYGAADGAALNEVFRRITTNLGNQWRITYDRPPAAAPSDSPVVSFVVDNSGSMDTDPENSGCDYRIERVRQAIRRFVLGMPAGFAGQILTFHGETTMQQCLTDDRARLLRAVAAMEGDGTTDILGSLRAGLETLRTVPSTRRYLVYLTDAGLAVGDNEQAELDTLLGKLADANVATLFLGLTEEDPDGVFKHAAKLAKGTTVVSTDLNVIAKALDDLAATIRGAAPASKGITVGVSFAHRSSTGEVTSFAASEPLPLPVKPATGAVRPPDVMSCAVGEPLQPYDGAVARFLSGDDALLRDVRVQKRIPLDVAAASEAVELRASEALVLTRLRGVDPPARSRFLALPLTFTNVLPAQDVLVYPDGANHPAAWVGGERGTGRVERRIPTYVIPDVRRHLFLRIDRESVVPISEATWLAEAPLVLPGEPAVAVEPGKPVTATAIFLVPEGNVAQLSLHHFDTAYGHLDLPLVGTMPVTSATVSALPTEAPTKLSDAFSLVVTEVKDEPTAARVPAGDGHVFRVVELCLVSKVQAHLDVDPSARFSLRLPTHRGDLVMALHPVTDRLPMGFYRPTMLTPGSTNRLRLAFRVPEVLARGAARGTLVVDVSGGAVEIPLGGPAQAAAKLPKPAATGQGLDIHVFAAAPLENDPRRVAVEATLVDHPGGLGFEVGSELVVLRRKGTPPGPADPALVAKAEAERREKAATQRMGLANFGSSVVDERPFGPDTISPDDTTTTREFGLCEGTAVAEGMARRGLFLFTLPDDLTDADLEVASLVIPSLTVPVDRSPSYRNEVLESEPIARDTYDDDDGVFLDALKTRLSALERQRAARGFTRAGALRAPRADFSGRPAASPVPCPTLASWGLARAAAVDDIGALRNALGGIRVVPSEVYPWANRFCEEAVWSQGWCTENEVAVMAEARLARSGVITERIAVDLADEGRSRLAALGRVSETSLQTLPALRWKDADGRRHVLVAPFLQDVEDLAGVVRYSEAATVCDSQTPSCTFTLQVATEPSAEARQAAARDMGNALAGGGDEDGETLVTVLQFSVPLTDLSRDAVDMGWTSVPGLDGEKLYAVAETPRGRVVSDTPLETGSVRILREILSVQGGPGTVDAVRPLAEGASLTDRFHTVAVNVPDLTPEALKAANAARKAAHDRAASPDGL